jgi:hypothetical protein
MTGYAFRNYNAVWLLSTPSGGFMASEHGCVRYFFQLWQLLAPVNKYLMANFLPHSPVM